MSVFTTIFNIVAGAVTALLTNLKNNNVPLGNIGDFVLKEFTTVQADESAYLGPTGDGSQGQPVIGGQFSYKNVEGSIFFVADNSPIGQQLGL